MPVAVDEPAFEADFASRAIFRGPSWMNINWYLYWGLGTHGYTKAASQLATKSVAMADIGGMCECYNPYTAEGYGAVDFGWSSLILDMVRAEEAPRQRSSLILDMVRAEEAPRQR